MDDRESPDDNFRRSYTRKERMAMAKPKARAASAAKAETKSRKSAAAKPKPKAAAKPKAKPASDAIVTSKLPNPGTRSNADVIATTKRGIASAEAKASRAGPATGTTTKSTRKSGDRPAKGSGNAGATALDMSPSAVRRRKIAELTAGRRKPLTKTR